MLPNNNYLVHKLGTKKTQVVHRLRLRQFTPRQRIPDIRNTPRDWKSDAELFIKHDRLYARAWKYKYEESIFDSNYNKLVTPNSPEITVQSERAADEARTAPGTIRESSPEIFPEADRSCGGTDTDHYMKPDGDASVEQPDLTPTNPRGSNYDLRHNSKSKCNGDCRYLIRPTTVYGTHT